MLRSKNTKNSSMQHCNHEMNDLLLIWLFYDEYMWSRNRDYFIKEFFLKFATSHYMHVHAPRNRV